MMEEGADLPSPPGEMGKFTLDTHANGGSIVSGDASAIFRES